MTSDETWSNNSPCQLLKLAKCRDSEKLSFFIRLIEIPHWLIDKIKRPSMQNILLVLFLYPFLSSLQFYCAETIYFWVQLSSEFLCLRRSRWLEFMTCFLLIDALRKRPVSSVFRILKCRDAGCQVNTVNRRRIIIFCNIQSFYTKLFIKNTFSIFLFCKFIKINDSFKKCSKIVVWNRREKNNYVENFD